MFAVCLGGVLSKALDPSLSKRVAQPQVSYGQAVGLPVMD